MKTTHRITGGVIFLLALLGLSFGTPATAQGPTATPASPTNTLSSSSTAAAPPCTAAATFVSDVTIPDNTVVTPGQTLTKTWRMRNAGTCTWGPGYTLAFLFGQALTSNTSVPVPVTAPGATADLSVPMTAPTTAGTVQGFWELRSPSGLFFAPPVWVRMRVASGAPAPAPTLAPGLSPASGPAQAPALVAAGTNLDDPARAMNFGTPIPSLSSGTAEWFLFNYDNGGNALPRPFVTILLLNGVTNGLGFEVYTPESVAGGWTNNKPVGRGTTEIIANCNQGGVNAGTCQTNNLSWTGGFGLNGTYYVRVVNNTGSTIVPQLIIGGPGLAQCAGAGQSSIPANTTPGQPFAQVQCPAPAPATPTP
ncbi:MAG: NBR1-Ig-like domain-containing protein [Chloroflexi bacterium]|nr:NBR1-Ig-like domain-containing protein [Chloroflexota bacterium]